MQTDRRERCGRVASLHLHPDQPGAPLRTVESTRVVEGKGIEGNPRYFGRTNREGFPSKRQVTLIEREQIADHAAALARESIAPGLVRSNIETTGIDLIEWIGKEVQIGEAVLSFYAPRDPCEKMDAVCQGLRKLMLSNRQGVLAQVIKSGAIRVGDSIQVRNC
jgi:MOSC domain-containing protein YiiM